MLKNFYPRLYRVEWFLSVYIPFIEQFMVRVFGGLEFSKIFDWDNVLAVEIEPFEPESLVL